MNVDALSSGLACIAFLALAALAVVRARRDPLASRFAALCVVLFTYNVLQLLKHLSHQPLWDWLQNAAASMCPAVFYHFTMAFLGQRRTRRLSITLFYVYFAFIAAGSLAPVFVPRTAWFPGSFGWAMMLLVGMVVVASIGVVRLVAHARRQPTKERALTALMLASILVAACGNATDLADIAGANMVRLGTPSLVVSSILFAMIALQSKLLDRVSWILALNAVVIALGIVLGEVALYRFSGDRTALLAIGSIVIALSALLAGRFLLAAFTEARSQLREQAARGRMSKQLGHDLRNPLGAIKGAAQFLQGEVEAKKLDDETARHWLDLIVKNTDRVTKLIERYEHLAKLEPELRELDVNPIVEGALDFLRQEEGIKLTKSLGPNLPPCMVDADLLMVAVGNVARNAREAMEKGGAIKVSTRNGGDLVTIEIADDGPGMSPATRENAFDDFYTTKATGSGLGLPFVQRVMLAHRGSVKIDSTEGKGTTVTLSVPIAPSL